MRIIPISEIFGRDPKETIGCCAGRIIKLYPAKRGTNQKGDWSFQRGTLQDKSGEIQFLLKDRQELTPEWKGRNVIMMARQGDKGFSGIYVEDDEYQGKVTRIIRLTPSATIDEDVTQQQQKSSPPPPSAPAVSEDYRKDWPDAPESRPAPAPAPEVRQSAAEREAELMRAADRSLIQIMNLWLKSASMVNNYAALLFRESCGQDMTESERQAATSSVFIQATRAGLHNSMQARPLRAEEI